MGSTTWAPLPEAKRHFTFETVGSMVPLELDSVGYNPEQEPVDRPGGFAGFHWLQTEAGVGEVRIGPHRFVLEPHQGLLLTDGLPHAYEPLTPTWSTYYLTFRGPMAELLVSAVGRPTSTVLTWAPDSPLVRLLAEETDRVNAGLAGTPWSRSALVYQFLTLLRESAWAVGPVVQPVSELHDRLRPLFEFVENHLSDPGLGVEAMADFLGVSPRQLNELFAKVGDLSPYQYLKERRMIRARQLLLWYRELGVKEVSFRVGFRDPSHFIHTFRLNTGKAPEQFRRAHFAGI